jgi:hypothetical protein
MRRGEFTLQSYDPPLVFTGELGDQAPVPTDDSYGGLQITTIPKRLGLTEYAGQNPMGLTIDFYVDRYNDGNTDYVRHQRKVLELLAGRKAAEDYEPPVVVVNGLGRIPHDVTENPHVRYQIESLTWDRDLIIIAADGGPLRIGGTISLREFNVDETLGDYHGPAQKHRRRHKKRKSGKGKGGHAKPSTYVVKQGDTLTGIAARVLGDSKRWREIADLNKIRNPRDLRVGRRLRMPK